jgi:hypothetical protein
MQIYFILYDVQIIFVYFAQIVAILVQKQVIFADRWAYLTIILISSLIRGFRKKRKENVQILLIN